MIEDAYPLYWPAGIPRTPIGDRQSAKFSRRTAVPVAGGGSLTRTDSLTITMALDRLRHELALFNNGREPRIDLEHVVVSSNMQLALSLSKQKDPQDAGVAVYFSLDGERRCIPSDKWDRVADNIAGIAAAIGALRGLERWVNDANVRAAFKGFAALPDPNRVDWRAVLGLRNGEATAESVKLAYRRLAAERHPDVGGSDQMMAELNRARDEAVKELGA